MGCCFYEIEALSFYTTKTIYDGSKLVWTGSNMTFSTKFCTLIYVQNVLNMFNSIKVIIDKSRGEVSLLEQDTLENVS